MAVKKEKHFTKLNKKHKFGCVKLNVDMGSCDIALSAVSSTVIQYGGHTWGPSYFGASHRQLFI